MGEIVIDVLQKEKKRLEAKIKKLEAELEERNNAYSKKIELLKELDSLTNKTLGQGTRETVLSKIAEIDKLDKLLKKDLIKMLDNLGSIVIQLDNVNYEIRKSFRWRDL